MRARAAHFYPYSTPPYTPVAFIYHNGGGPSEVCLSIVHFGSWCIRQMSCYTLLGRFPAPTKMFQFGAFPILNGSTPKC